MRNICNRKTQGRKLRMALALGVGFMVIMLGVLYWMENTDASRDLGDESRMEWRVS